MRRWEYDVIVNLESAMIAGCWVLGAQCNTGQTYESQHMKGHWMRDTTTDGLSDDESDIQR